MAAKPIVGSRSGLPLGSLPAIVLDTETTGLDIASDRIIEIGAMRISGGKIDPRATFSELIDPGLAIPPRSSAIHGITDEDVRGADAFRSVFSRYQKFAGEEIVIGYSIGFDLAMLKSETGRCGLPWTAPRSLDVRHLVKLIAPQLPSESLETAAGWLGVPVATRHRALADAELTAQVFLALVPRLAKAGISTLGQARRACMRLASHLGEESAAGWHDVIQPETLAPREANAFARIDSFAYRHRVGDIMAKPPAIATHDQALRDVLARMMREKISSLFIAPPPGEDGYGIVTERDILRAIDGNGTDALDGPAFAHASRPLVTIGADEFVYRAMSTMATRGFRHLAVTDEAGALVGALSARDLLKQRAGDAVALGESIEQAISPPELGLIWSELTIVVRGLASEGVSSHDIAAVISRELRALTKRACELVERELRESGEGEPPCRYAMLVLGSCGRGESLLAMDQDNTIVFEQGAPDSDADLWFARLAKRVSDILNDAGVVYCKGGVMASNAVWRHDLAGWRGIIGGWITHAKPEDILSSDIFFDAIPVHGDITLGEQLRREAIEAAAGAADFLKALAIKAGDVPAATGMFGRLKLVNGRIDLKRTGLMPIFSAARVVALRSSSAARASPVRLAQAANIDPSVVSNLTVAHGILLRAVLNQQLRDIDRGIRLGNSIAPAELSSHELDELKWALDQVPAIRDVLGLPTFG